MILTSNRGFAEWGEVFGDPVVATALLDRLLHHAVVVHIEGASYRLRQHADLVPEALRPKSPAGPGRRHTAPPRPTAQATRSPPPVVSRPLFDPPEAGRNVGTPFVPTDPRGHGAQERSRDETALRRAQRRASLDGSEHRGSSANSD